MTGCCQDLYAELSEQCKKYACDLLEQCRSSDEVIAVLNKSKYSSSATSENDDDEEDAFEGGVDEPIDEREFEEIEDDVDSPDDDDVDDDDDSEKITLDRFKLALKYEQKQVEYMSRYVAFHLREKRMLIKTLTAVRINLIL